jgi:hypothetical protein
MYLEKLPIKVLTYCTAYSSYFSYAYKHRGRVLSFFSNRRNWSSPTPLAAGECAPPPFGRGGGHTRLRERGWGSPNSDEGTHTVVLCIYKYFVHTKKNLLLAVESKMLMIVFLCSYHVESKMFLNSRCQNPRAKI